MVSMGSSMKLLENKGSHASDGKSSQAAESLFVLPCPVATLEKWQLRFMGACANGVANCPPKQTPSKIYSHLHQGTSTKCSYAFWRDLLGSQGWQA